MKVIMNKSILLLMGLTLMSGCMTNTQAEVRDSSYNQNDYAESIKQEAYVELEPAEWVEYIKPVNEYFHYRTQAVLHKNIEILWEQYPELQKNVDKDTGVNSEQFDQDSYNHRTLIDANFACRRTGKSGPLFRQTSIHCLNIKNG